MLQPNEIPASGSLAPGRPRLASKKYCLEYAKGVVTATALQTLLKEKKVRAKRFGRRTAVYFDDFLSVLAELPDIDYDNLTEKPPRRRRTSKAHVAGQPQ